MLSPSRRRKAPPIPWRLRLGTQYTRLDGPSTRVLCADYPCPRAHQCFLPTWPVDMGAVYTVPVFTGRRHHPLTRDMNTGVILDTREQGPSTRGKVVRTQHRCRRTVIDNDVVIIRPHRSTTYVDAAYCYRLSSVVCRSVCHTSEPCKNDCTDRATVWVED